MKITQANLEALANALIAERKRQKLSREDAAAVCGVSTSFIRDAESNPENCGFGKLSKLINGLGFGLEAVGLNESDHATDQHQGVKKFSGGTSPKAKGLIERAMGLHQMDFGVPASQLSERKEGQS